LVQPTGWLAAECFYIMAAVYLYPFSYLASDVGHEDARQQIPSEGSPCCSSSTCLDGLAMYGICFQLKHPVLSSSQIGLVFCLESTNKLEPAFVYDYGSIVATQIFKNLYS
jgi:hypothetical protein